MIYININICLSPICELEDKSYTMFCKRFIGTVFYFFPVGHLSDYLFTHGRGGGIQGIKSNLTLKKYFKGEIGRDWEKALLAALKAKD